jgi:hypothetical protein
MNKRFYQPQLLWGYFAQWIRENISENERDFNPKLFIFRTDQPGAYRLHGPKLYWAEDLGASYFTNCDQDALEVHADVLGEVQAFAYRDRRKNPIQWNSLDEFVADMGGK